jgi:hypothetical protein
MDAKAKSRALMTPFVRSAPREWSVSDPAHKPIEIMRQTGNDAKERFGKSVIA